MFVLRCRLKARPQALHRFGIVDAYEQSEIAQAPLQNRTVRLQKVIRNRHPRRGDIDAEPIAIVEFMDEFS